MPRWPPEPFIYVPPPSDLPPVRISDEKLNALQIKYRCQGTDGGLPQVTFERLDARTTMLLLFATVHPTMAKAMCS